jgi:hypothetical protein
VRDFLTAVRPGLGEAAKGFVLGLLLWIIIMLPGWLLFH